MKIVKKYQYAAAAFFIPFFLMVLIMILTQTAPFGENSFMIVDALHQYLPFFADYQEKLKNLDSWFYSWNGGLGYNFFSLWAYYLSSPINLIIALVPKMTMISVLNWIIVLKFSLCSLAGFSYFTHQEGRASFSNVVFGLCYCFSSYMTGYYWNVMWLEVMILLPVILIGMDKLMKQGDGRIYCLSLFGSMFCNYYMSFMVCIFLIFWYLCYHFENIREFLKMGIRFVMYSILAAAMAAMVLFPAYQGLMATSSATLDFPQWQWYEQTISLFSTHMAAVEPYNMSVDDGLGNLYCGVLPMLLLVLYVIDNKILWKEKIRKIVLLVFLAISSQMEMLNYIWHGFHNQYGIPNRFAFLYIFLILIMAYEQWNLMKPVPVKRWKVCGACVILLAAIGYLYVNGKMDTKVPYIITAGLLVIYMIGLCMRKQLAKKIICLITVIEIVANTYYAFDCSGQADASYYFAETEEVEKIKERQNPTIEQRMELLKSKMLDESIWHTMPNATMFGSTALGNTVEAMDQLGFYTGVNEYLYEGASPVTDLLLGIKSVLVRNGDRMYRTGYEYLYSKDGISLYENALPTGLGYWMNKEVWKWNYQNEDPFEVQNELIKLAYQCPEVFNKVEVTAPVGNDCDITDHHNGSYFVETKKTQRDNVAFVFNIEENQDLYLHFDCGNVDNTVIYVNGREHQSGRLNSQIVSVGNVEKGDTVTVELQLKDGENRTGTVTMRAASLNQEAFRFLKKQMKKHKFEMISYSSNEVKGIVNAQEDGMVFFSIPYDEGWKIYIDGKAADKKAVAEGFLAIDIKKGEHVITLSYIPPGFLIGWKVSLIGWAIFLWINWRCKKRFRKNLYLSKENMLY